MRRIAFVLFATVIALQPVAAAVPRQTLTQAAFATHDKATALAQIGRAKSMVDATLARGGGDRDTRLVQSMAVAYRAKLTRSRGDAIEARRLFEMLVASDPRDPEAQAAIGAWHIDAVATLGGFLSGAALGASRKVGLDALDRAVALGDGRALFPALNAMLRLSIDANDANALAYAEKGARGTTTTEIDRIMRQNVAAVLVPLRAGQTKEAQAMAKRLLPFGTIPG